MGVIREKRQVSGPRPVGVIRRDTGVGDKYRAIAEASQKLTSLAIEELGRSAAIQGEQRAQALSASEITAINPKTGKPEALDFVRDNAFIGRVGLEAYQRVVNERFQAEIAQDIKEKAGEIAIKFENDPYSVEKYEDQMNTYLQELAKSSEVDGKATAYTNFITSQGAEYITATKLSMMQERQRRERAKLANSHINQNLDQTDAAYELGKGLNFEKFDSALPASVERNTDLENAAIFQQGSATAHSSQMREAFVNGVVQKMLVSASPLQRAKLIDALQRGNASQLHAASQDVLNKVFKYVDSSNKASILSAAKQVNANLRAIQAEQDAYDLDVLKQAKIGMLDGFINDGDAFANSTFNSITDAYNSEDFGKLELAVKDAVQKAQEELLRINNASDELMSADQKQFLSRDIRQGAIEPLLAIAVRSDPNNATDLALAINNNDSEAFGRLNEFQASIVEGLRSPDFPMTRDDVGFVASFLAGSVNEVQRNIDNYYERSEFDTGVTNFIKNEKAGVENEKDINTLVDEINSSRVHTGPQKDALKNRLRLGFAYSEMNKFDSPTSTSLNALQQYLSSEGKQDLGLTEAQKLSADQILSFMTDENSAKILGEVGSRQANYKTQELEDEAALKAFEERATLAREALSGGTAKTKKHREHIDSEVLPRMELSIFDANSQTEELYAVLKNTMSQQLIDTLKGLASGTQNYNEDTANLMLNHFARLRYDMDVSGTINRFGDLLTGKEYGILEDALAIRNIATGTTEPISTIITKIRNEASTDLAQKQYDAIFGPDKVKNSGNTPAYDYVYSLFNDTRMALELEPIAEYYAKTNRTKAEIKQLLNDVVDNNYAASEYIVDPSMPPSMMGKSRHALSIFYPDPDERAEFLNQVQSALPDDVELSTITGVRASEAEGMERVVGELVTGEASIAAGEKTRAFLVPFGPSNEPQYYVYYQDKETKELRPLIYNKPTYDPRTGTVVDELTWPMFDSSTTEEWQQRKLLENQQKAAEKVEDSRALFESLRESSKRRGYQ